MKFLQVTFTIYGTIAFICFFLIVQLFGMKNIKKSDFDQRLECTEPTCWSKYTTKAPMELYTVTSSLGQRSVEEGRSGSPQKVQLPCPGSGLFLHLKNNRLESHNGYSFLPKVTYQRLV